MAPDRWLVKGGGGAHTREKIVAVAAERFVVIADSTKTGRRDPRADPPRAAELRPPSTLARIAAEIGEVGRAPRYRPQPRRRRDRRLPGEVGDPAELAAALAATPGVVDHGLFPASMVTEVLIGRGDDVERA